MSNKSSPLVLEEEYKTVDVKEVEKKVNDKIPNDYIPVKLASNGKLDAKKVMYFRDYTMDDALELNVLDEDDQLKALLSVLTTMSYEKFDCKNLHIKELMEILYTLHGTFIGGTIEKEYYIDEDLKEGTEEGCKDHPSNISTIEVKLAKLVTKNIDEDLKGKPMELKFKEPFTLYDTVKKVKMQFKLSRVGDMLFAQEYCNTKFEEELLYFKPLKKEIQKLQKIKDKEERKLALNKVLEDKEEEYDAYHAFNVRYDKEYVRILQSLQVVSINGKVLETLEEKIEAYKTNISETLWQQYNQVTTDYDFGILQEYKFYCDKLQKNITRGFLFQLMDFLPNPDKNYRARYNLSFD